MRADPYPPIADYALIGDCHTAALLSRQGSIDWCSLPRFDGGSYFGRLLDWERGGFCQIAPTGRNIRTSRRYVEGTMVLETTVRAGGGEARLLDCFTMRPGGRDRPHRQILRVVEGVRGRVDLAVRISPRFDYGEVRPWIRRHGLRVHSATGGNDGLLIRGDVDLEMEGRHDLRGTISVHAGERHRLSLEHVLPERLDERLFDDVGPEELDRRLDETIAWWRRWAKDTTLDGTYAAGALRSSLVLKTLTNAPTGAMVAAPTTSLPEAPGGARNWDYRFSWIRDSCFAVRALGEVGHDAEADGFRRFVERSAAGSADELQIMYGVGGERRLVELELRLEGYRGARPVRVGNAAYGQLQLDVYGELLDLAWRWHRRGQSPDDDYWRFLVDLVDTAAARWEEPDRGIWELRARPRHLVHSKAMCWAALDRGLRLAEECGRAAPVRRWRSTRRAIREAIEQRGYDARRGVFVQTFGRKALDASLLLLPSVGFVDYGDERMVRTVDAIQADLDRDGLILRYEASDGLDGEEGTFLACTFWLAECLARQERGGEAREVFDRAVSTANDLGLFAEEFDPRAGEMLGNFPQGLTHLSHLAAAAALAGVRD